MKIRDHVFVVTGAGSGIGAQVALELLRRGARVAGVDLRDEGLDHTSGLAGSEATRFTPHVLDITDREAVAGLPAAVIEAHGRIDGLLNVAGIIQRFVPVAELTDADVDRVMAVNFEGPVALCRAFLPHLVDRPQAAIVNVSSMGALAPVPGQTVYGASKAALSSFTQGLYSELRGTGVAVTVVYPGAVETPITANSGVDAPAVGGDPADLPPMTSPADAATRIVEGLERGSYRVLIGKDAIGLDRLARLSPQRATDLIARRMASLLEH